MRSARVAVLAVVCASLAFAAGREFDDVVKAIETHFGVTRTHIPMLGVANMALHFGHPAGTSGFRLALFQDLKTEQDDGRQVELDRFMDRIESGRLRRLIRTHSREARAAAYIFCGETGKDTQLLIATFHPENATVIEVKVNFDTLLKWIQSPELAGQAMALDDDR